MKKINRQRIVKLLFAVAVIEILFLIFTTFLNKKEVGDTQFEMSALQIDSTLKFVFEEFNLCENLVEVKSAKKFGNDSLLYNYAITLPGDVSLLKFLEYLNEIFPSEKVILETREAIINQQMSIGFYSSGFLKVFAEIKYDKTLLRNTGEAALLLTNLDIEDTSSVTAFLIEPEKFTFLFPPSERVKKISGEIFSSGKSYELILTNSIGELKYRVDPAYSTARLKATAANLRNEFPAKNLIIVDEEISTNKIFFGNLKNIFAHVKFELIPKKTFLSFESFVGMNDSLIFLNLLNEVKKKKQLQLTFTTENLNDLTRQIRRLKMRGVKTTFYFPPND